MRKTILKERKTILQGPFYKERKTILKRKIHTKPMFYQDRTILVR